MVTQIVQHGHFPTTRLRRLRHHPMLRTLTQETCLSVNDLILPLFIRAGATSKKPILSMPGHFQWSLADLPEILQEITTLSIKGVILFGIPSEKNSLGTMGYHENGIIQQAIPLIKQKAPHLLIFTDLCFCEYTDHGHCGVMADHNGGKILDNDQTLPLLAKQAVSLAEAGADVIAPSGMLDGMVGAIRLALDTAGFQHIPILSYSIKYASAFYGPFRDAAEGAPLFGDRRTHQANYANTYEALHECALDIAEGADMLMVKPAHAYLDIIARVKETFPHLPLAAYHTSGEFAMLKAAAEKGWIDECAATIEILTAIKRAGANIIITYTAKEVAVWLNK